VAAAARRSSPSTADPEVVVAGIVCYDHYMDPIALAWLPGRTGELAAA
jgi:hypothetical protein